MSEFEITPEQNETASYEVETPKEDSLAREAGVVNAMSDANEGIDPFERAADPEYDAVQQWVDDTRKTRPEQLLARRGLNQEIGASTESVDRDIVQYQDDVIAGQDGLAPYRQKVEQLAHMQGASEEVKREAAYAMKVNMETAELWENADMLDMAGDVAGLMVPFNVTDTLASVGRDLGFTSGFLENAKAYARPGAVLKQMQLMAQNLDPEDRDEFRTAFMEALDRETDNELDRDYLTASVFDQLETEGTANFFAALDAAFLPFDIQTVAQISRAAGAATGKGINRFNKITPVDAGFTGPVFGPDRVLRLGQDAVAATSAWAMGGKAPNIMRRLPTPEIHEVLTKVSKNPEMSARASVTQANMADAVSPGMHGSFATRLTGAPTDASSKIVHMLETQNARMDLMRETAAREGLLTPERQFEVMVQAEDEMLAHGFASNVIMEPTTNGFTMKWQEEVFDDLGRSQMAEVESAYTFKLSDIGDVAADSIEEYSAHVVKMDPNARFSGRLRSELVTTPEGLLRSQAQHVAALKGMMDDAFKGLNKSEVNQVDALLLKGSRDAKEYNWNELVAMDVPDKIKQAYFGQRNISHKLHELEDERARTDLIIQGARLIDTEDGAVAAKVYDNADSAYRAYRDPNGNVDSHYVSVLDDDFPGTLKGETISSNSSTGIPREVFAQADQAGFVLARNHYDSKVFRVGDNLTQWAFVKRGAVHSPEGRRILNRIEGYVPKSRTDSFFFVKKKGQSPMTGARAGREVETTVAWSDNITDAQAYMARLEVGNPGAYSVRFDREMDAATRTADVVSARGGLFGGKRKSEALPFVGKGDVLADEGAYDLMQRYVNHVARQTPSHLWRVGTEQRFLARARQVLPAGSFHNPHTVLEEAAKHTATTSREYKYLKDVYNQMASVNRIPTTEEQALAEQMKNIGIGLEGTTLQGLSKFFYRASARNFNPADSVRGVTFTTMLGMYNPSQLLVQGSGAIAAFAVNPVSALKALPKTVGWQTLDMMAHNPLQQKRMADWMRANDLGDYADSYMVWVKSGFREAIVESNADFATIMGRKSYDANMFQRIAANNTIFYEMGEAGMSRASLATAIEWYKDAHKVARIDHNDVNVMKAVTKRAEQYRLNMGRANRSQLNTGLKAVPLQFKQVISKYYEKVLPQAMGGTDEFTAAEKIRLAAIPAALFGSASLPFVDNMANFAASMMGENLEEMAPEDVVKFKQGTFGWMMSDGFGVNVDFTSRMSLGSNIIGDLILFAEGGGGNVLSTVLGPTGNVLTRLTQGAQYVATAFDLVIAEPDVTVDDVQLMGKVMADALLAVPSSTRNAKAYWSTILAGNDRFHKDGKFMWEWEDMNTQTAVMGALGFQPTEQVDLYQAVNELRTGVRADALQLFKPEVDVITRIMTSALTGDNLVEQRVSADLTNSILRAYGPFDQAKILKGVRDNMYTKQYDTSDVFFKLEFEARNKMEEGLHFMNKTMSQENENFRSDK